MSKAQRLARLRKNLAQTTDLDQNDKDIAYSIFILEKEFNIGPITDDYLALKYFNLMDEYNINRFTKESESSSNTSNEPKTIKG